MRIGSDEDVEQKELETSLASFKATQNRIYIFRSLATSTAASAPGTVVFNAVTILHVNVFIQTCKSNQGERQPEENLGCQLSR